MKKCFHGEGVSVGQLLLSREESHHLCHVLRGRIGDAVAVLDGRGTIANGKIIGADGGRARLEIAAVARQMERLPRITLLQAALTAGNNGDVVRWATAIGVAEIIFFGARRGECHLSGKIDGVIVHWRSIAVEACKQSGNPFLPSISHCKNLGAIDLHRFSTKIFGGLSPRAIPLRKALETASIGTEICVAIGPEGDFSAEEYAHLAESGFVECRFARHVLRSEVAASMAVGLVAHLAEG